MPGAVRRSDLVDFRKRIEEKREDLIADLEAVLKKIK